MEIQQSEGSRNLSAGQKKAMTVSGDGSLFRLEGFSKVEQALPSICEITCTTPDTHRKTSHLVYSRSPIASWTVVASRRRQKWLYRICGLRETWVIWRVKSVSLCEGFRRDNHRASDSLRSQGRHAQVQVQGSDARRCLIRRSGNPAEHAVTQHPASV
jgi:hypothetical protein